MDTFPQLCAPKFDKRLMAKTLLIIFPDIDAVICGLRQSNYVHGIQSFREPTNTEKLMERIIRRTYHIQQFEYLKVKIEKQLNSMPDKTKHVARLFFLEKRNCSYIAETMNLTVRSIQRKVREAIDITAAMLNLLGITDAFFESLLYNHFVRSVYQKAAGIVG